MVGAIPALGIYGSSGPGRGKSWTNVTFRLNVRGCYRQKKANIHTLKSYYLILAGGVSEI